MGAQEFFDVSTGQTHKAAFAKLVKQARYDHGHAGYSGTVAEKDEYTIIKFDDTGVLPEHEDALAFANSLVDSDDPRINDKWGPCGCVEFKGRPPVRYFLFFGWAAS